jgi:hypothetical protein
MTLFNPNAFEWGAKAARLGLLPSDNPYLSHRERAEWNAGFEAASLDGGAERDWRRAA